MFIYLFTWCSNGKASLFICNHSIALCSFNAVISARYICHVWISILIYLYIELYKFLFVTSDAFSIALIDSMHHVHCQLLRNKSLWACACSPIAFTFLWVDVNVLVAMLLYLLQLLCCWSPETCYSQTNNPGLIEWPCKITWKVKCCCIKSLKWSSLIVLTEVNAVAHMGHALGLYSNFSTTKRKFKYLLSWYYFYWILLASMAIVIHVAIITLSRWRGWL